MPIRFKQIKMTLISLLVLIVSFELTGCASLLSSKMPKGSVTMQQAYNQAIDGSSNAGGGSLKKVREHLNALKVTLPSNAGSNAGDTRSQENEIDSAFQPLPNPNIIMYVYPHEVGSGDNLTPVPGYSTVFSLYLHVYYQD